MKFIPPKSGWRTYAVVFVGVGLGVADYFGYHIPGWAETILGFAGLGTLRSAVRTQSAKSAADVAELAQEILASITLPDPNKDVTGATVKAAPVEQHQLQPVA